MRIALATEYYYPHLGGVTEHVHHLAAQLNAWGHRTIVITGNMRGQGRDPAYVRRIGRSRTIYSNGSFARLTTGWGLTRRVTDLLRRERIDLVHVQDVLAPTQGLVASSAAWRHGLPGVAPAPTGVTRAPRGGVLRG
ncbi:MAG TPA: glycosyltransferase, partial [Gemmatimonadales bacterium]